MRKEELNVWNWCLRRLTLLSQEHLLLAPDAFGGIILYITSLERLRETSEEFGIITIRWSRLDIFTLQMYVKL
jgi:hypothetical protein